MSRKVLSVTTQRDRYFIVILCRSPSSTLAAFMDLAPHLPQNAIIVNEDRVFTENMGWVPNYLLTSFKTFPLIFTSAFTFLEQVSIKNKPPRCIVFADDTLTSIQLDNICTADAVSFDYIPQHDLPLTTMTINSRGINTDLQASIMTIDAAVRDSSDNGLHFIWCKEEQVNLVAQKLIQHGVLIVKSKQDMAKAFVENIKVVVSSVALPTPARLFSTAHFLAQPDEQQTSKLRHTLGIVTTSTFSRKESKCPTLERAIFYGEAAETYYQIKASNSTFDAKVKNSITLIHWYQ